jgi:SAM-dependent methyltransferase
MSLFYALSGAVLTLTWLYWLLRAIFKYYDTAILSFMMKQMHSELNDIKHDLFTAAYSLAHASSKTKSKPLRILEIGVGTGSNFTHYPARAHITLIDKTSAMEDYYKQSVARSGRGADLVLAPLVVCDAAHMPETAVRSGSYDLVVHTFVLCSVDEQRKVLGEIERVLRPGGVCVFVEHAAADSKRDGRWRRLAQRIMQPLFGDCKYLNMEAIISEWWTPCRSSQLVLKRFHFSSESWLLFTESPVVYGYAVKSF